jgi:hypothetical protein
MASNKNNGNGNGNGNNDAAPPTRSRKITADDLTKVAEAAREAATAASTAAEAVVVALESGEIDEAMIGMEAHGTAEKPDASRAAFEGFMAELQGVLKKAGNTVSVTEHARWVKIEGVKNGHKVYVAKGKNHVSRIESTLPPNLVPGAVEPDRKNGRIQSYIPADPKAVAAAIRQLAQLEDKIPAPQRPAGGGGGGGRRPQVEFN